MAFLRYIGLWSLVASAVPLCSSELNHQDGVETKLHDAITGSTRLPKVLTYLTMEYLRKSSAFSLAEEFILHDGRCRGSVSPDKTKLIIYDKHRTGIYVMDLDGNLLFKLPHDRFVAWHPRGDMATVVSDGDSYMLRTQNIGEGPLNVRDLLNSDTDITSAAFHPNGKKLAYVTIEGACIWRITKVDRTVIDCPVGPHELSWSSQGDKLIVHFAIGGFGIYGTKGNLLHRYNHDFVRAMWSPTHNNVLAVRRDYEKNIEIWNLEHAPENMKYGQCPKKLLLSSANSTMAWSSLGDTIIASETYPKQVVIIDVATEKRVEVVKHTIGGINDDLNEVLYTKDLLIALGRERRQLDKNCSVDDCHVQIFKRPALYDITVRSDFSGKRKSPSSTTSSSSSQKQRS